MKLIVTDLENPDFTVSGEYRIAQPQKKIHFCAGCFGCWIQTPGRCVMPDGYDLTGALLAQCSEVILVSRCCYGSVSPFVKAVLDRGLSYLHPDFEIRRGEMHHKLRYENHLLLSAHLYGENITDEEKETARKLLESNADNYDGSVKQLCFYRSAEELAGVSL